MIILSITLEWTSDKLVLENKITPRSSRKTSDMPQEPMYVLLAGGLDKPI